MKLLARYKNGNVSVTRWDDGTTVRRTEDDEFRPAFVENVDCKITDRCDGGCQFCYEGCTPSGKHGDILNDKFINSLHPYTEMALNGNDLSHPHLIAFLSRLKEKKVIANLTVNQIHFERHYNFIKELLDKKLIWGLGISLREPTDAFINLVKTIPNAVIHTINGIYAIATLLGTVTALVFPVGLNVLFILAFIGGVIDNFFYLYIYNRIKE